MEVNHKIAIVRSHGIVKRELPDAAPATQESTLEPGEAKSVAIIRYVYVELQLALRSRIASVEDLLHNFIPEVQFAARNPWLIRRYQQSQEGGCPCWCGRWFTELSNFIQLTYSRLAIDDIEYDSRDR